jgi:hypothetical protein
MVRARLQPGAITQPVASGTHDPPRGQFTVGGGLVGGEEISYPRSGGLPTEISAVAELIKIWRLRRCWIELGTPDN